ncbi:MAG: putative porin, partial [Bacteroidota bacterium]|nr:putative porin [Bacteroidota bacterium]
YYHTLSNTFSWKNSDLYRTKKSLGFDFGITHKYIKIDERAEKSNFNQIIFHARISKSIVNKFVIGGEAEYVQGDYNTNDFKISGIITNGFGKNSDKRLTARLDQISRQPSWFYSQYYSNNFVWSNDFKKENIVKLSGNYSGKSLSIGVNYFLMTNYTYFDTDTLPTQAGKSFSLIQAYIYNDFKFGNFKISDRLYFQKTSTDKYLRLPELSGKIALSYSNAFFDKALYTQLGIDIQYRSAYSADAYMPAIRSFYQQDDIEIGDFIYADVYASIKIKRTRIVVKYRHANQLISPYDYYDSPHHPMKDSGIVMAVSWCFHD